jgi:hypothetical protein
MSHPFFGSALPIHSLDPDAPMREAGINDRQISSDRTRDPSPSFPSKPSFSRNRGRHSENASVGRRKRPGEVRTDLRCLLNNEIRQPGRVIDSLGITRRVVSDPLPRNPGVLDVELRACTPQSASVTTPPSSVGSDPSPKEKTPVKLFNVNSRARPYLGIYVKNAARVKEVSSSLSSVPQGLVAQDDVINTVPVTSVERPCPSPVALGKRFIQNHPPRIPRTPTAVVPIGTVQPTPFTTHLLKAQTYKSAHGQITVLPSRSLLVDFREGERRRGKKGNEVFIVDPTGMGVSSVIGLSPLRLLNCFDSGKSIQCTAPQHSMLLERSNRHLFN